MKKLETTIFTKGFLASIALSVTSMTGAFASNQLADNTVLVLLAPHANRAQVYSDITNEAQSTVIHDFHVNREDYSVLHVTPGAGQSSYANIRKMMKHHPEIKSVSQNYIRYSPMRFHFPPPPPGGGGGGGGPTSGPDPNFPSQWPLASMRWSAGQKLGLTQAHPARITILSSGTTPVTKNNELGAYITQYNLTVNPGQPVKQESVHNSSTNPPNYAGVEGDVDSSITGCLTNNATLISGSGCFAQNTPCYINMYRITNPDGSANDAQIQNALAYAINNQAQRGGRGPVSLSFGGGDPSQTQGGNNVPLWADSTYQSLGQSLLNQGDVFVVSAGDTQGTWSTAYPPGSIVVVQGTNINNNFDSSGSTALTLVKNDPCGAPGDVQPAVIGGKYNNSFYGSSFSAPLWASAIAMVMSVNSSLTSAQAHQIILNTGTPIGNATWTAVIPAFDKALQAAKP